MVTNDQFWFMASALLPFANTLFESDVTSNNPGIGKQDSAKRRGLDGSSFYLVLLSGFCAVAHSWGRNALFGGRQLKEGRGC